MKVTLDNYTPLYIASKAIRQCWASQGKSDTFEACPGCGCDLSQLVSDDGRYFCPDCGLEIPETQWKLTCGDKDRELIERIGNKFKHASTLEHLYYNFTFEGVSRALLQELARHRITSPSVKSTRYTLKELKDEDTFHDYGVNLEVTERVKKFLVMTGVPIVDMASVRALENLRGILKSNVPNDMAKYCLPESYKVDMAWSINARSLQNFIHLRSSKSALWEIRDLTNAVFEALPEDHKYLFKDSMQDV